MLEPGTDGRQTTTTQQKSVPQRVGGRDWRSRFFNFISPGLITGIKEDDWIRLLTRNRFRITPGYWPKAAFTTALSGVTSAFSVAEHLIYDRRLERVDVPPPLFVLGHWRSGTTHLHNLLSLDDRFTSPGFSEVTIPHTFLTGEWLLDAFLWILLPPTRFGIDNVPISTTAPSEEEFALAQMTFCSPYLGWAFPKEADKYDRFVSFRQASEQERDAWKNALRHFIQKLTLRHGKPLVMKSPANTARIRMILEIFPEARFVHIHRDPYTVYQSTRHLHANFLRTFSFQSFEADGLRERILRQYTELFDAFFADRSLIPSGRFTELSYTDLEDDPLGQIARIYDELDLGNFCHIKEKAAAYLDANAGYCKNRHPDLPEDLRSRIVTEWRRSFEEWGYPL